MDHQADLPRRLRADAGRSVRRRAGAVAPVGARRREPAASLRADAAGLERAIRGGPRRGGTPPRAPVRTRVAPLPAGLAGHLRRRLPAVVPTDLRPTARQRLEIDPGAPVRRRPGTSMTSGTA